jgi:hypothetical protein
MKTLFNPILPRYHGVKYQSLAVVLLVTALLTLQAAPTAAAETDTKTVLLKVHVPFSGG